MDYAIEFGKAFFLFNVVMVFAYLLTWMERKQSAVMQDRIGANRAGFFGITALGLFHNIADAIKMITKEDFVPPEGNRLLHTLAPVIALTFALTSFAVIPFGGTYQFGSQTVSLQGPRPEYWTALRVRHHEHGDLWFRFGRMVLQQQLCTAWWTSGVGSDDLLRDHYGGHSNRTIDVLRYF